MYERKTFFVIYGMKLPEYAIWEKNNDLIKTFSINFEDVLDRHVELKQGKFVIIFDSKSTSCFVGVLLCKIEEEDNIDYKHFKLLSINQMEGTIKIIKEELLVKREDINLEYLSFVINH